MVPSPFPQLAIESILRHKIVASFFYFNFMLAQPTQRSSMYDHLVNSTCFTAFQYNPNIPNSMPYLSTHILLVRGIPTRICRIRYYFAECLYSIP